MSGWRSLNQMRSEAVDLTRLHLDVQASAAHPGGRCVRESLPCPSCHQAAQLKRVLGSPVIHCSSCQHGWGVKHDPMHCWRQL